MKAIQRSFLISLVPLFSPTAVFAQSDTLADLVSTASGSRVTAATWRASEVIGQNVKNAADETIGEVEDLLIDMKSGKIHAVVISSGGFLGMADALSAVPVSALRFDVAAKAFKTKLTKEQLGKAPQFKSTAWPEYGDVTSAEAMRSYRDSIGGDVTEPDNTAQNEKPTNKDVMIPTDQGNSAKDIQITKDIRSSIMNGDMSFNAKNIKVITKDEQVHLKGVVKNHAEHEAILKIAKSHANASKITDELEVDAD